MQKHSPESMTKSITTQRIETPHCVAVRHFVEQNTPEWYRLRAGMPTASSFDKIVTPAKGDLSTQSNGYMNELLAELVTGHLPELHSAAIDRGHEVEPEARKAFELMSGLIVEPGGFWTDEHGRYGASPDGLLGSDGHLELKCPYTHTHIGYLRNKSVDRAYWVQLQGQLLVTGREYVIIHSYYPDLPSVTIRVGRDEPFIGKLRAALDEFCDKLMKEKELLTLTV